MAAEGVVGVGDRVPDAASPARTAAASPGVAGVQADVIAAQLKVQRPRARRGLFGAWLQNLLSGDAEQGRSRQRDEPTLHRTLPQRHRYGPGPTFFACRNRQVPDVQASSTKSRRRPAPAAWDGTGDPQPGLVDHPGCASASSATRITSRWSMVAIMLSRCGISDTQTAGGGRGTAASTLHQPAVELAVVNGAAERRLGEPVRPEVPGHDQPEWRPLVPARSAHDRRGDASTSARRSPTKPYPRFRKNQLAVRPSTEPARPPVMRHDAERTLAELGGATATARAADPRPTPSRATATAAASNTPGAPVALETTAANPAPMPIPSSPGLQLYTRAYTAGGEPVCGYGRPGNPAAALPRGPADGGRDDEAAALVAEKAGRLFRDRDGCLTPDRRFALSGPKACARVCPEGPEVCGIARGASIF